MTDYDLPGSDAEEIQRLEATIAKVRAIHWQKSSGPMLICAHCMLEWPCPTITILDGEEEP